MAMDAAVDALNPALRLCELLDPASIIILVSWLRQISSNSCVFVGATWYGCN